MSKLTKKNRTNKMKNRSKKYFGGKSKVSEKSDGVFDIIGDKLSDFTGKAANYVEKKGLRLAGLQPIKKNDDEIIDESTKQVDEKINELSESASGLISNAKEIGSDIVKVFDKGSAAIVGQINDVLESPKIENSVREAAEETAEIGEKLLKKFNDKLSTPEFKEETKEALENVADYAEITIKAMDEPVNDAVDKLNEAGTKAASGAVTGLIKVSTDAMAAVPGAGAIVELGKIVNDTSAAVGDVVEAATDATSTVSKVIQETSENINESLDKLEEKKKEGEKILSRTNKSIKSFESPATSFISGGGRKTKRKLFKHKGKSKRVRFAI
jgi:ABC-type transporter Mla subunit MlaD